MVLQSLPIDVTSLGNQIVIPGVAGLTIEVFGLFFQCGVTTILTIKSNTVTFTGPMKFLVVD